MPPVSRPTASSFEACKRLSSSSLRSETSNHMPKSSDGAPSSPALATIWSRMCLSVPSALRQRYSSVTEPVSTTARRASSTPSRSSGLIRDCQNPGASKASRAKPVMRSMLSLVKCRPLSASPSGAV